MRLKQKLRTALEITWVKVSAVVLLSVVAIVVGFGVADAVMYSGKVHRGISVSGVSLGGSGKERAVASVERLAQELEAKEVAMKYKDEAWVAAPAKLNVTIDTTATVERALKVGRSGAAFDDALVRMKLWLVEKDIEPVFNTGGSTLDGFIAEVAKDIDRPFEDADIKVVDGSVVITNSKNGKGVDRRQLEKRLMAAFGSRSATRVAMPVETLQPNIHESSLKEMKATVKQMVKEPVQLTYEDKSWEITPDRLSGWLEFPKVRQGNAWVLDVDIEQDKAIADVEKLTASIATEAKDAQFEIAEDTVTIIPSKKGTKVDIEAAITQILEASKRSDKREAALAITVAEPKLSTEEAEKMGIKERVSTYTTHFNAAQTARVHNIKTLSRELDGVILAPDEVFSFNGNIGPRTASKGYTEAPAIINGELVPSLGGGVCQVATTLFNTIFFGGYEVVERHNHSLFISHYPAGRDATVSYGGPDLKFKNNTPYYVLIKAYATSSALKIDFFSTSRGVKVEYSTSAPYNYRGFQTKYEDDATLAKGVKKVKERGSSGKDITVNRTIRIDGKVVKKDKFVSKYKPQHSIVLVGTKEEQAPAQPGTTQPPTQPDNPQSPVPTQSASQ